MLRTLLRGAAAGAIGTVAMDLVWYARYRNGGGESAFPAWEFSTDVGGWDSAPAPAQVGRKLVRGATGRDLPPESAGAVNNVMHWVYGTSWAAQYALLPRRPWWSGPAFGATVWSSGYVILPLLDIYRPIWTYDVKTLWQDLSAHLVFGTVTDGALRALPA
jgi:hypothetical protein